jgi:hypothetical protein
VTRWKHLHNAVASPVAMSLADVPGLDPYRSTALEENDMTASYTFDVFSSLDTATAPPAATGLAIGASKAPSCSTTPLPCTARSS